MPTTTIAGVSPRNTQRHPKACDTRSARIGPIRPGTTQAVATIANSPGRSSSSNTRAMAMYATAGMMPAPSPWMNRPATSTDIDGASPPNRSPAVNVAMPHASAGANPRRSASWPPSTMPIIEPRKNAVATHPYHTIPWRSASMSGRMLITDSVSDAVMTVPATRPNFTARRENPGSSSLPAAPAGSGCPLARSLLPDERIGAGAIRP